MIKAIDLFCGVGGMSLGVRRCGVEVIKSLDHDWRHVITYNNNFKGDSAAVFDLSKFEEEELISIIGHSKQIDMIFGGPPCQGFSVGGKQKTNDDRNNLIFSFLKAVEILRPQFFIMENVYGILGKNFIKTVENFLEKSNKIGYKVETPIVLNAKNFYIPQDRKRVFFIGSKNRGTQLSNGIQSIIADQNIESPKVKDAIFDFNVYEGELSPKVDRFEKNFNYTSDYAKFINDEFNDLAFKHDEGIKEIGGFMVSHHDSKIIERFNEISPGEREPISRYLRLHWEKISPTLRAGTTRANGQFMASRPIHPTSPRCITVREAARLHSFPDWFEFFPTKWYGHMQIGNSVPPLLAQAVAKAVISKL